MFEPIKEATNMNSWENAREIARIEKFGSIENWRNELKTQGRYYQFTNDLIADGFRDYNDVDIALQAIAEKTGYDYNYLVDVFDECEGDFWELGEPIENIVASISQSALEYDLG